MLKGIADTKWIIWAIEHKEIKMVIGTISIWNFQNNIAELGFGIMPGYQGKGLMKEALLAVLNYGLKNFELSELDAYTQVSNLRSIELLRSCRFAYIREVVDKGCVKHKIIRGYVIG